MQSRLTLLLVSLTLAACTSPIDLDRSRFYCVDDSYCLSGWRCDTEHNACVRADLLPDTDVHDAGDDTPLELPDWGDQAEPGEVEGADVPADEVSTELPGCVASACDDGNPCTQDFCNDQGECDHEPIFGNCSDGDACTVNDHCEAGACKGARLSEELYCDGQDEDCDGQTDEVCPCFDGDGDTYPSTDDCEGLPRDCDDGNADIRPGGVEVCGNGVDDDCDGADRFCGPRTGMNLVGSGAYLIDAYEASACPTNAAAACSLALVFPWRDLSWDEAQKACRAGGKHLCSRDEWQLACGGSQGLKFPYGGEYDQAVCNTQAANGIVETGSFASCLNSESGAFDMVGNVAEWVGQSADDTLVAGGEVYLGKVATCTYAVQPDNPKRPWIGFRCCLAWDDDNDGDGSIAALDCDDGDASRYPGKTEVCNTKDDDCDGQTDEGFDQDDDGWPSCTDCDDTRPAIHPGQDEVCNGIDEDCNGKTDDGFPDVDNDKHGDGCGDCNDADPKVYQGAAEVCDGKDNDCDGTTDEGFTTVDQDGDGWNDCGDCDDTVDTTYPGAPETCNCVDDDCDGATDEPFDADGDGFGGGPDCEALALRGLGEGGCADCDDADAGSFPGAPEPCDGKDNDCDGDTDEGYALLHQPCDGPDADKCKRGEFVCNAAKNGVVCGTETAENLQERCNGQDDDCNGFTDEAFTLLGKACDGLDDDACTNGAWVCNEDGDDVECAEAPGTGRVETCNHADDDCDGTTDELWTDLGQACDGPDPDLCTDGMRVCAGDHASTTCSEAGVGRVESCNGQDDTCDGFTDEGFADLDLDGVADCVDPDADADGVLDDGDGDGTPGDHPCTDGATEACDDNCRLEANADQADLNANGVGDVCEADGDDDGDPDFSDCRPADPFVHHGADEGCLDGVDNDCDGLTDCLDPACAALPSCTEMACGNGQDDDGDGLTDCRDPNCDGVGVCFEADCTNGLDDEDDGRVDCGDPDCADQACSDQTVCTTDDRCVPDPAGTEGALACVGTPVACSDPDPCTDDLCDPELGCTYPPKTCADGLACTIDSCEAGSGACLHEPVDCDDGLKCTIDACDPTTGTCLNTPVACADATACTDDACNPDTGLCEHVPTDCDDLDECTVDTCSASTGCKHTPRTCNDFNQCTVDTCDPLLPGGCVFTQKSCNDTNACTTDACQLATGECKNTPISCNDSNACTDDNCDAGTGCVWTPRTCADIDPCTEDGCSPISGCTFTLKDCDDGEPTTVDSCNPVTGDCEHL